MAAAGLNSSGHLTTTVRPCYAMQVKWEVDEFCNKCKKANEIFYSAPFAMCTDHFEHKWRLRFIPKSLLNHASFYIESLTRKPIDTTVEMRVITNDNRTLKNERYRTNFDGVYACGFPCFVSQTVLDEIILKKERIYFVCQFMVHCRQGASQSSVKNQIDLPINTHNLKNDYESLLGSQKFSDVTLLVQDEIINAHKCILSHRSSVFAGLLEHESNDHSVIKIEETEAPIIKEMLRFIYAGKVNDINTIAYELLKAAAKYAIQDLVAMCERAMIQNLSTDNVCYLLHLSLLHDLKELKRKAVIFIANNTERILEEDEDDTIKDCEESSASSIDSGNDNNGYRDSAEAEELVIFKTHKLSLVEAALDDLCDYLPLTAKEMIEEEKEECSI